MMAMDVVIIGGLHHNTLGVIRSLGEAGLLKSQLSILICGENISNKNFISMSKYVLKDNISYTNSSDGILPWLKTLSQDGVKRVIICCSDDSAEIVMHNKAILKDNYKLPSVDIEISDLMNKETQGRVASENGLIIPISKVVSKQDNIYWDIFPCITKPIKSVAGSGKADIHISNNSEELQRAINDTEAEIIQIQQFIIKKMEYQLIGCSINAGEKLIIPGYTTIIRQPDNTNTGYLIYNPIKSLEFDIDSVGKFIKTIGYSGLFSIEFIRDNLGNDYFLEINMRNDGNAYCVNSAGINLPYIWYYYQSFGEFPNIKAEFEKEVWFIPDFNDVRIGIKEVGIFKWVIQFIKADSHSIFNVKDIKPFLFEAKRRIIGQL